MNEKIFEVKVDAHMDSLTKKSASVKDLTVFDEGKDDFVQFELNDELKKFLTGLPYILVQCDYPFKKGLCFMLKNWAWGKGKDNITTRDFLAILSGACKVIKQNHNRHPESTWQCHGFNEYNIEGVEFAEHNFIMQINIGS